MHFPNVIICNIRWQYPMITCGSRAALYYFEYSNVMKLTSKFIFEETIYYSHEETKIRKNLVNFNVFV